MMKLFKISLYVLLVIIVAVAIFAYKGELSASTIDEKYSSAQSQFLTMDNGARVHFRDEGNPTGKAVVLVHGSNASLHTWEPWVAILGQSYRVITLDLPAHGLTGAVPDQDYSSRAQLNTLDALVQYLALERFTLGGNSMGGGVTWRYTLEHPQRIDAMILIDSSGLPQFRRKIQQQRDPQAEQKEAPLFFTLMSKAWFRTLAKYIDPYWMAKQGVESSYNHSPVVTDQLIDRYYELALREGSREATLSRFSAPRPAAAAVDGSLFSMPSLIMWGREDSVIPVEVANMFAEELDQSELIIYDDVGHIPMEEIPARSAQDVLAFLAKLDGNG
jgi:pimeloyl-ACP methyl ester carboxylesterase